MSWVKKNRRMFFKTKIQRFSYEILRSDIADTSIRENLQLREKRQFLQVASDKYRLLF